MHRYFEDISLVFGGAAGQGVQTITETLIPVLQKSGYHVFSCTEYMSRIRGGCNTTQIRVTDKPRAAYLGRIDLLFALSASVVEHLRDRISADTLIFAEKKQFGEDWKTEYIDTPLLEFAAEAGSAVFSNSVAAGMAAGMLSVPIERLTSYLRGLFAEKGEEIVAKNSAAVTLGHDFGKHTAAALGIEVSIPHATQGKESLLMDGTTALGIGAVAAGCNFITSYPMSPGTGLITFLANRAETFGIVVDQAEDEIAAVNTALGASYAGARAVVTTSGGGFDLMQEGVSLCGMIETPIVLHVGQRPGPATGLPTRTEQGDLSLLLHAGHGEFMRAIFTPGTLGELIETTQQAFNLAERFQIPVFLLTDQFLLDSVSSIEASAVVRLPYESAIIETSDAYRRFAFTENGVSPRGVPGFGEGIVRVDSDEHDEEGLITESFTMRRRMVEKRLKRRAALGEAARMPSVIGTPEEAETLVISWGSNRGVVEEALERLNNSTFAGLHFSQVYPLNPAVATLLGEKKLIVLENNATGQFADLLCIETRKTVLRRILKATGEPFSVEEVTAALKEADHE